MPPPNAHERETQRTSGTLVLSRRCTESSGSRMDAPGLTLLLLSSAHPGWTALRAALSAWPRGQVLADVPQAAMAVPLAAVHRPGVLLVDAAVSDRPLVSLVGDLRAVSPASKVIVLDERAALERATLLALWHRGVVGYFVWEDLQAATVRQAILLVQHADVLVGSRVVLEELLAAERRQRPRIAGLVLSPGERAALQEQEAPASPQTPLTEPEREVAALLAEGYTNAEIATRLELTEEMVKMHVRTLLRKFDLHSRRAFGRAFGRVYRATEDGRHDIR